MAENHLRGQVIGVAFDGTGFGTDGKIWGGEFLVADFAGFTRRAHLRYVPLPGGDAAVRQPWRMALSYLRDAFGRQHSRPNSACFPGVSREADRAGRHHARASSIQTVETSSCGRLFDAVAAILGICLRGHLRGAGRHRAGNRRGPRQPRTPIDAALSLRNRRRPTRMILDLRATILAIAGDASARAVRRRR